MHNRADRSQQSPRLADSAGAQSVARPRLALVPPKPATGDKRLKTVFWPLLDLWHLLSLDAPTVAALWVAFVAWSAGVRLSRTDPLAMFVAVWILYAADRLLDARPLGSGTAATSGANADVGAELEERHWFHHRHRGWFRRGLLAAALLLTGLLHPIAAGVLHLYVLLASLLAGWLILVHAAPLPDSGSRRLPKELAVGLFFPAAVFIPTVARAPGLRLPLLPDAMLFAAVCSLNCLLLYAWEHPVDQSRAHLTTRWAVRHAEALLAITLLLALALGATAVVGAGAHPAARLPHPRALAACCGASTGLLWWLHTCRRRLAPLRLRALADFVLLTPVPVLLWVLLGHVR